jgi:hypothetical protein
VPWRILKNVFLLFRKAINGESGREKLWGTCYFNPSFFLKNPQKMILHYHSYHAQGGFGRTSALATVGSPKCDKPVYRFHHTKN